jgi:predicted PurR-regulated permease PerM
MARADRRLSVVLRAAPLLLFLWMVRSLLVPVALGALFAMLLDPLRRRIEKRWPRLAGLTPLGLTVGAIVLVVIPFSLLAVRVVASVQGFLAGGLGQIADRVQVFAARHFSGLADDLHLPVDRLRGGAVDLAQRIASAVGNVAGGVASSLPGQIVDVFLFVLALYFFLRDGAAAVRWILRLMPFSAHDTDELFESIRRTVHGALVGQLAVSLVQGGLTLLALYLFEVPGALMFGMIATLLSVLPLVGTMPVTFGAVIYLLSAGRLGAAAGMAVAAAVIGLSDNVIRPWVQSTDTRMHPLVTLLAIFGGLELLGWAGVFLGPVIAVMARWTVDLYAQKHEVTPEPAEADEQEAGG